VRDRPKEKRSRSYTIKGVLDANVLLETVAVLPHQGSWTNSGLTCGLESLPVWAEQAPGDSHARWLPRQVWPINGSRLKVCCLFKICGWRFITRLRPGNLWEKTPGYQIGRRCSSTHLGSLCPSINFRDL